MEALNGMRVKLLLKRAARENDYHTGLARIKVDGDRVSARCIQCGCHRLALGPNLTKFLLAAIAAYPAARDEIITLSDGHYENS